MSIVSILYNLIFNEFGGASYSPSKFKPAEDKRLADAGWGTDILFPESFNAPDGSSHRIYVNSRTNTKGMPTYNNSENPYYIPPTPPETLKTQSQIEEEKRAVSRAKARDVKGAGIGRDAPANPASTLGALSIQTPTLLGG